MATGIVLTVVEKLYAVLHSEELREICSMFGYESQLDELGVTVSTIKCVLLDAESKHQELNHGGREYIERLKDAFYDVDDLLDEFNTMVQKEKKRNGGKISKKVRRFFSRSNQFLVAFNMSHEIKNLRSRLDKIAKDRQEFGFSDVYVPLKRRPETMSFTTNDSIIGREVEREAIVGMLLGDLESPDDVGHKVDYVTIVGIGGLGKTALAQLVYNDDRIERAFELKLWVCISDDFVLEHILRQMLGNSDYKLEELQTEARKLIEGKRYLLVLDDAWSESRNEWDKLKSFLDIGGRGSRVVVTSRSRRVAKVIGYDHLMYELEGLSEDNSWNLFKRLAFIEQNKVVNDDHHLFDIGKDIVKRCANVPLCIRVIGSLLYDQDESKWLSLRTANLVKMGDGEDDIMPVLKHSYYHLTPALKSCFSYCALFPKDFRIEKELIIRLWLAQGCLDDERNDTQTKEDVGEEYFSILLHRCFLQDVIKDGYGEIESCKMHDLMHDLAQEVAGKETIMLDSHVGHFNHKIRHLSLTVNGYSRLARLGGQLKEMKALRTFFHVPGGYFFSLVSQDVSPICSHLRRSRVLDLGNFDLYTLTNTLGYLSHLRYLNLSRNHELAVLPDSITKLHNLEVLILGSGVRELPRDMRKLVNLRHLDLQNCYELTHMPSGLDNLTNLCTLSIFVVGDETSKQGSICKLNDLKALVNLRGELKIIFNNNSRCNVANYTEVELIKTARLKKLCIHFEDQEAVHETLLAGLQPYNRLKGIEIHDYKGFELSTWAKSLTTSLPYLVKIHLVKFDKLEILPSLSQLRHLKYLKLQSMANVEFMENDVIVRRGEELSVFFPSLEELRLDGFPKLKGWWREEKGAFSVAVPSFPRLYELVLSDCPRLRALPPCPNLRLLRLYGVNEGMTFLTSHPAIGSSSSLYLKSVSTDKVAALDCLFGMSFVGIHRLYIENFKGECLSQVVEKYLSRVFFMAELVMCGFPNLKSLSRGGLENFTNLQSLEISNCDNLNLENNDKEAMPWKSLRLSSLSLSYLPKLTSLPREFHYLTSLQFLDIRYCENFDALPEWLDCFRSSLRKLWIQGCPKLKSLPDAIVHMPSLIELGICKCRNLGSRCREPDGEDWQKIRHITRLRLEANDEDD